MSTLQLKIVYDNNPFKKELKTDWGFSCFVTGLEKTILFDTGARGEILLENMAKLGIAPQDIDIVFLSHDHKDHTGGLKDLLQHNPKIQVWLPDFFPNAIKELVWNMGASLVETQDYAPIFSGAWTTGIIFGWIKEQSLLIETKNGLLVLTGCAHPRITEILSLIKNKTGKDIYVVIGGFHLGGFSKKEIRQIIAVFQESGVKKVGPCHCTGEKAQKLFQSAFTDNYLLTGVGKEIEIE